MKNKICVLLITLTCTFSLSAQIDTIQFEQEAEWMFPSFPIKSSYTSLFDRRVEYPYAYSANMEHGLGIYDVSNPNSITPVVDLPVSSFNNLDVATIEQRENSLFAGIGDFQVNDNNASGLAILDISDPENPEFKDIWDSTLFTHGISHLLLDGNYVYLSTMTDGLIILDITDESNIQFKSHLQPDLSFPTPSTNAHNARGLKIKNDSLYMCFDRGGLRVIDVTDKTNPVEVYKYINNTLNESAAAAYNDIAIHENYAFISVDYCGLEIVDISTIPFTPVEWYNPWGCDFTNWSGAALHTNEIILSNNDSLLFVSGGQSELFVFDITNPLNVHKKGEFVNLNDTLATHGLDVFDGKVLLSFIHTPFHIPPFTPFFADPGGLKIVSYEMQLATAVNEITPERLLVFPNPISGSRVSIHTDESISHIQITSSVGEIISVPFRLEAFGAELDVSALENGSYLLSIFTENSHETTRLIVCK